MITSGRQSIQLLLILATSLGSGRLSQHP